MTRLVLGSRNKKKLREMIDLLGDLGLELTDLTPYPHAPDVEETADTFVGNATLKATQLAPALGAWVIGEDSGLVVPALAVRRACTPPATPARTATTPRTTPSSCARWPPSPATTAPRTTSARRCSPTRRGRSSRRSRGGVTGSS